MFIAVVTSVAFQWLVMAVVELSPDEALVLIGADVKTVLFDNTDVAVVFHWSPVVAETLPYMLESTEELVNTFVELREYTIVELEGLERVILALSGLYALSVVRG